MYPAGGGTGGGAEVIINIRDCLGGGWVNLRNIKLSIA